MADNKNDVADMYIDALKDDPKALQVAADYFHDGAEEGEANWAVKRIMEAPTSAQDAIIEKLKPWSSASQRDAGERGQAPSREEQMAAPEVQSAIEAERMKDPGYALGKRIQGIKGPSASELALAPVTGGATLLRPVIEALGAGGEAVANSPIGRWLFNASPIGALANMAAGGAPGAGGEGMQPQAGVVPVGSAPSTPGAADANPPGAGGGGASAGVTTSSRGSPYTGSLGAIGRESMDEARRLGKAADASLDTTTGLQEDARTQSGAAQQQLANLQERQTEAMAEAQSKIEGSAAGMAAVEEKQRTLAKDYDQKLEFGNLLSTYGGAPIALVQQFDAENKQANARLQEISGALSGRALTMEDANAKPEKLVAEQQAIQAQLQQKKQAMGKYTTVDPDRWATANSGRYFMAALGAALADIGGVLAGGGPGQGNAVMLGLYRRIDEDISAQKQQFTSRKEDLGVIRNNYELAAQMTQSEFARHQIAGAFAINALRERLQGYGQMAQTEEQKAALTKMDAEMSAKMTEMLVAGKHAAVGEGVRAFTSASTLSLESRKVSVLEGKAAGASGKIMPTGEIGKQSEALATAGTLENLKKRFTSENRPVLDYAIRGLSALTPGWTSDPSQWQDRMAAITPLIRSLYNTGVFSDKDYERGLTMLPSRGEPTERGVNKLNTLIGFIKSKVGTNITALEQGGYRVPAALKAAVVGTQQNLDLQEE